MGKNQKKLFLNGSSEDIQQVQYRPFDFRFTYYPLDRINEIIPRGDSRWNLMRHLLFDKNNMLLISTRQLSTFDFQHIFVTRLISDMCLISLQTKETSYAFSIIFTSKSQKSTPFSRINLKESYNNMETNKKK